jgi:hypothetical protein
MYHDEHLPPHCHAVYAGVDVQVRFAGEIEIVGDFPMRQARLVREWAELNRAALVENWGIAAEFQALKRIAPLA